MDIGLRPDPLPPIVQVSLVDYSVSLFMVTREVDIVLRSSNLLHITMVDYIWSTQGFFNNLFQGVFQEKNLKTVIKALYYIHIIIILIIIIQAWHLTLIQTFHHTLIQAFNNNLSGHVHISLLLLFMHLI